MLLVDEVSSPAQPPRGSSPQGRRPTIQVSITILNALDSHIIGLISLIFIAHSCTTMPTTLKVWSFHKSISLEAKENLLRHFGALSVQHVGRRGKDEAVLASFQNDVDCKYALSKLHQQEILGVRLKAVYMDSALPPPLQEPHRCKENVEPDKTSQEETMQRKLKEFEVNLCSIASSLGINHPIPPNLRYEYPPPSASIIANIAQVLTEVPRFYTQVLHLMNKMNLPPPFRAITDLHPIHRELLQMLGSYAGIETAVLSTSNKGNNEDRIENDPGQASTESESESELESEGEGDRAKPRPAPVKRTLRRPATIRKKPKLSLLKQACMPSSHPRSQEVSMKDVFETTQTQGSKRLEVKLRGVVLPTEEDSSRQETPVESGTFGKIEAPPTAASQPHTESMEEWPREADNYIRREDILANRVAKSEWPILPVFKNYIPGEPSPKLYIKNLAKATTETDLKYIFGRYIFWQNDEEADQFSISLMKEGRMKGQAFITFPSVRQASEALQDTNGFILNDKPMVVAFGRVRKEQLEKTTSDE